MKRKMGKYLKLKIENVWVKNVRKIYIQFKFDILSLYILRHVRRCFSRRSYYIIIDNIYNNNLNSHILLYSYRS